MYCEVTVTKYKERYNPLKILKTYKICCRVMSLDIIHLVGCIASSVLRSLLTPDCIFPQFFFFFFFFFFFHIF